MNEMDLQYWNTYLDTLEDRPTNPNIEVGIAGNNEIADELLQLYLSGKKELWIYIVLTGREPGLRLIRIIS